LLAKYAKIITEGKEKYEQLVSDQTMDMSKRKTTILSMIDNILRETSSALVMATQPKITFPVNKQQIEKFFENLAIDDCDQPFPPVLTIKKIRFSLVVVEWKVDERQVEWQQSDSKRILEFSLEYAKIPKDKYRVLKKDSKQINENDKKIIDYNENKTSPLIPETTDFGLNEVNKEKQEKKEKDKKKKRKTMKMKMKMTNQN